MTRPKPKRPPRVAGERVDLLVEALRHIEFEPEEDGMVHVSMENPPEIGDALARAVMRVEAELAVDGGSCLRNRRLRGPFPGRAAIRRVHDPGSSRGHGQIRRHCRRVAGGERALLDSVARLGVPLVLARRSVV